MKHIPIRSCIVCREQKDKSELLRIVLRPDGVAVVDKTGREPGRGAYVCKSRACIDAIIKKQALSRAFRKPLPREVYEGLSDMLGDIDCNV